MVTGICYGFEVMRAAESPNTPFTVLYERFETGMYAINPSINSQTVEQANSLLKRMKSSISYMNAKHFMIHLKLYQWYRNSLKSKDL